MKLQRTYCGLCQRRNQIGWKRHLLVCRECRDRLQATDKYVAAMKVAAGKVRESGTGE
jgi:hypothetical protein